MTEIRDFINKIAPIIQKEALKRGYNVCSAVIAQAVIESRYGKSTLAKYHNYFGLKCGKSWKGKSVNLKTKEEYVPGTLTTIKDNFRAYISMNDGVVGYYDFISTKRYSNLKSAKNYIEYASMLKQDGYATSSTYVSTIVNTVIKYGLDAYDELLKSNTSVFDYAKYTKGHTYVLTSDLYIRDNPDSTKVKYDCITLNAKEHSYFDSQGNAILKKGTKVTCKDVSVLNKSVWIRIPSGWICAENINKKYIE